MNILKIKSKTNIIKLNRRCFIMNYTNYTDINDNIECSVAECKYHHPNDDYCTLDKIHVEKHSYLAHDIESTDCGSFEKK